MFWILYLANYLCFQFFSPYSLVEKKIFILLTLLCLYEIQWNSYQPFFWRDVQCNCAHWHNLMGKFDGRTTSEISLGHVPPPPPPPQHLLTAITLLGGGAGDRETRAKARCELRLRLLCSLADSALLQVKSRSQRARAKGLRVRSEPVVFPLKCILCFLPASALSLQRALVLGHRVSESVPGTCWGTHWCGPSPPIRIPGHFLSTESTSNGYLPNSDAVLGLSQG